VRRLLDGLVEGSPERSDISVTSLGSEVKLCWLSIGGGTDLKEL
jgi:hypothetical protein